MASFDNNLNIPIGVTKNIPIIYQSVTTINSHGSTIILDGPVG